MEDSLVITHNTVENQEENRHYIICSLLSDYEQYLDNLSTKELETLINKGKFIK